jgi:CubicO group peptidase (beta-lactamase class C family)
MKNRFSTFLAIALIVAPGFAHAQFGRKFAKPFEASVEKTMDYAQIPGLVVVIVHDSNEVYSHAFGVRDVETQAPLKTTDLFHWASVTKPFVATASMQLVEAGKLDLDAPVTDYLPYFKMDDPAYTQITPRLLLTHTAGMPDVSDYEWDKPQYDDEALERWVRQVGDRKLIFPPGTDHTYSNIGFEVMGDVIAKASGISFEDYVAQHIFEPLKMTKATLLLRDTDPADRVSPHTRKGHDVILREHWPYNRRHAPSSTLLANMHDMARWELANLNRGALDGVRILKDESYDQLWKPTVEADPNRGLSWALGTINGHPSVSHFGSDEGFRTGLVLIPELNLGVAIAVNTDRAPVTKLMREVMERAIAAAAK